MAEIIAKGVRTKSGNAKIDYGSLANLPKFDTSLSNTGQIADAKAVGDAIDTVSSSIDSFKSEVNTKVDGFSTTMETFKSDVNTKMDNFFTQTENGDGENKIVTTTINSELSMGGKRITNLGDPEDNADAATKKYVDDVVGGIFKPDEDAGEDATTVVIQTTIQMAEDTKITGLGEPTEDTDAANKKYVDDENAKMTEYAHGRYLHAIVTLESDAWDGNAAPYTQEITIDGILATDAPHWGLVYSDNEELTPSEKLDIKILEKRLYALVDDLDSYDGKVIFTCFDDKPDRNLTIQIEVNRQWEKASSTE